MLNDSIGFRGFGLDENLQFLEPLTGLNREGGFISDNAPDLAIAFYLEPVLAGKATKPVLASGYDFIIFTHYVRKMYPAYLVSTCYTKTYVD